MASAPDLLLEDWKRTSGILKVSGIMTSLLDDMLHDNPQSRTVRLWNAITVPLFGKRISSCFRTSKRMGDS
jgi:hypothetical protein